MTKAGQIFPERAEYQWDFPKKGYFMHQSVYNYRCIGRTVCKINKRSDKQYYDSDDDIQPGRYGGFFQIYIVHTRPIHLNGLNTLRQPQHPFPLRLQQLLLFLQMLHPLPVRKLYLQQHRERLRPKLSARPVKPLNHDMP